jgi:hypothetical protein
MKFCPVDSDVDGDPIESSPIPGTLPHARANGSPSGLRRFKSPPTEPHSAFEEEEIARVDEYYRSRHIPISPSPLRKSVLPQPSVGSRYQLGEASPLVPTSLPLADEVIPQLASTPLQHAALHGERLLSKWTEPAHTLGADDLNDLSDMINQLSRVLDRPTFVVPWFYVHGAFVSKLELPLWSSNRHLRDSYLAKTWRDKRVSNITCRSPRSSFAHYAHRLYFQSLFPPDAEAQYVMDLASHAMRSQGASVIFIQHQPYATGSHDGHWLAIEHNLSANSITRYDSLSGRNHSVQWERIEEDIRFQWMTAQFLGAIHPVESADLRAKVRTTCLSLSMHR